MKDAKKNLHLVDSIYIGLLISASNAQVAELGLFGALFNRAGFPEGSLPHGFFPIRYIVRRASHPVISATVARLLRIPAGTHRVTSR